MITKDKITKELGYNIYRASVLMRRELIRCLREYRLTPEQWYLLMAFATRKKSYSQREICDDFSLDAPTISRMLYRMQKNGWVEKEIEPTDKRITLIKVTDKGIEFQEFNCSIEKLSKNFSKWVMTFAAINS
jgi:DNA-binding MarR family transcriptional regulator